MDMLNKPSCSGDHEIGIKIVVYDGATVSLNKPWQYPSTPSEICSLQQSCKCSLPCSSVVLIGRYNGFVCIPLSGLL